jgi:hypothetical protein
MSASGGWCDPRRNYGESEKDFIERVPDGALTWADEHKAKICLYCGAPKK